MMLDRFVSISLIHDFMNPEKGFDQIIFPLFDLMAEILRRKDGEVGRFFLWDDYMLCCYSS